MSLAPEVVYVRRIPVLIWPDNALPPRWAQSRNMHRVFQTGVGEQCSEESFDIHRF
jgi:hypothetical protein